MKESKKLRSETSHLGEKMVKRKKVRITEMVTNTTVMKKTGKSISKKTTFR